MIWINGRGQDRIPVARPASSTEAAPSVLTHGWSRSPAGTLPDSAILASLCRNAVRRRVHVPVAARDQPHAPPVWSLIYATVSDRTVTIAGVDQLRARFNANAFSGRVEGGYRFVTPWMGLTPYAAGQFTTFDLPAYTEQALSGANTFALNYASKGVTATRSELGVRTDKSWAMQDAIFTVRGRLAWAHDFNTDRNIAATFQTLPGASFVVNGAAPAHESALTTASAELKWLNGFSLAATFEGEFSDVTRSYAGKGVARYSW